MDQENLNPLIDRLEEYSRRQPAAYRLRVALLAGLGYAYLLGVVLLLLLLVYVTLAYVRFNFVTIKIVWIPLVIVGLVLRSLWVTIPEPDGMELKPEQAPLLFDVVREVQEGLNGPTANHILLSDEFNAGVVQVPRFGMFGWLRNYLVVGLPLLKGLSPEEFRSVLAHEFGHLSGKHGRFSGWIYRVRQSWIQVLVRVHQERHYASFVFEPFLNWYAPFFNAYSFVLARAQEYEADTYSVKLAGKEVTARTLVRLSTRDRILSDEFWPAFYRQVITEPKPPKDPFAQMLAAMETTVDHHKTTKWVHQALRIKTGYDDTHPALADRLAGLGYQTEELNTVAVREALTPSATSQTAADYYLNELPEDFVVRFNLLWKENISSTWREQHSLVLIVQKRLKELEFASTARQLTLDELWEQVGLVSSTQDAAAAFPLVKAILEVNPEHARANLALGAQLLVQKDAAGISYLEKAMSLSESTAGEACALAYDFHLERGELKEADSYQARAERFYERMQKLYDQSVNFSTADRFEPHGLSESDVEKLRTQLGDVHGLGRTYLVRKILPDAIEPLYVIGALATYTWRNGENEKHAEALISDLGAQIDLLPNTIFVSLDHHGYLIGMFEKVPGSVVLAGGDESVELRH